jgi:hypothetical protein
MTDKKPLIELEDKEPDVRIPINFRPEQEKGTEAVLPVRRRKFYSSRRSCSSTAAIRSG